MRHFAHHIGDYAAATAHLSFVEDAAYHRLLRRYYQDEKPLPADVGQVQRLAGARTKEEKDAITLILREFFALSEDGWRQSRADIELEAYHVRADTARENGKRSGGRPKTKRQPKSKPTDNQVGYSTDTQSEPSRTLTNNQEPITNSLPNGREGANALATKKCAGNGTRLPDGWRPDVAGRAFASDLGLDPDATADAFADWWSAASGAKAVKRDWNAAFRTWCRRDTGIAASAGNPRPFRAARGNDAVFEHLAVIANRGGN